MIVTTGKIIKVEIADHVFEKSCETPGGVWLRNIRSGDALALPGNRSEADRFVKAYLRAVDEEVKYRKRESE